MNTLIPAEMLSEAAPPARAGTDDPGPAIGAVVAPNPPEPEQATPPTRFEMWYDPGCSLG
jgi:hypothetical protein